MVSVNKSERVALSVSCERNELHKAIKIQKGVAFSHGKIGIFTYIVKGECLL